MSSNIQSLILGGAIPAILFGMSGIFTKFSTTIGISIGHFLIIIGLTACGVGVMALMFLESQSLNIKAAAFASSSGLVWATGSAFVTYTLLRYDASIGQLATVFNMNTLITVVLGLIIFSEWQNVDPSKLLLGALLVCAGGAIAASA